MPGLKEYASRGREYRIFVGMPADDPAEWSPVERVEGDEVVLSGGARLPVREVASFIVAYPNGEVLDSAKFFQPLPEGVHFMEGPATRVRDTLDPADLESGKPHLKVAHGVPWRQSGRWVYATRLTNVGAKRVRVLLFGAYRREWLRWQLSTVNRGFFSAGQFRAWYGLGDREWIEPGESVEDPDNYGGRPGLWAYFCETDSGERFTAGAELK